MIEISVCIGSSCHIRGSYNVIQTFQQMMEENNLQDKVDFKATFCMKQCQQDGVSVSVNGQYYSVRPEGARAFFEDKIMSALQA